jgi:uncharacterized protein YpmS
MKLLKRLLLAVALLLGTVVLLCSIGLILFRGTPGWYRPPQLSPAERDQAAQSATNKLAMIQNEAARARMQQRRDIGPATNPATPPAAAEPATITVTFTDRELNAFFHKWAIWNNWKSAYDRYLDDPVLILNSGRIILAGRLREIRTVASLHFEPKLDEQGQLHLRLVRVLGGNLPLPEAVLGNYREELARTMESRLPEWRRLAAIDRSGTLNDSAVSATMGSLLVQMLNDRPGEPVLFLPLLDNGAIAVKLTDVSVGEERLTLTVEPLTRQERADLLTRIQNGGLTAMGG